MHIEETEIAGVLSITPKRFVDDRGWFTESWNSKRLTDAGLEHTWVQDNESLSIKQGTVRGIHFQSAPHAQDKLVRVVHGRVFDVAVDLRRSSPTFRHWVARELTSETGNQLLIPRGFGHGFLTLTPNCLVAYKVTALYNTASDRVVAWDDPEIGITWPVDTSAAVLSDKDQQAPLLCDTAGIFD